jgi:rhodanese-related sulfurtransferase
LIRSLLKGSAKAALRLAREAAERAVDARKPQPPPPPPRAAPPPAAPPPPADEPALEVDAERVVGWFAEGRQPRFLDIRERFEVTSGYIDGAWLIPMNSIPERFVEIPRDRPLVVYCAAGARSYGVVHWMRQQGFDDAWSLTGGLPAWTDLGRSPVVPSRTAPYELLQPVRLRLDAAAARGVEADRAVPASVQGVAGTGPDARFALLLRLPGGAMRVDDVAADEIEPIGHAAPKK